jgi:hypothetical protein
MVTLEIREPCFIKGKPFDTGKQVTVDSSTAATLLSMGRAVPAKDEPEPQDPSTIYASSGTSTPVPAPNSPAPRTSNLKRQP